MYDQNKQEEIYDQIKTNQKRRMIKTNYKPAQKTPGTALLRIITRTSLSDFNIFSIPRNCNKILSFSKCKSTNKNIHAYMHA